jgi:predicted AAA+ superfamily ATPase
LLHKIVKIALTLLQVFVDFALILCKISILMYFKRHIISYLEEWRNNPSRKPLLLRGARQVGKTTFVNEFAKNNYRHFIPLNLERPAHLDFFKKYKDAKTIVEALFLAHNLPSDQRQHTLLFIDEIQESPEAIALLRYFYEDVPELPVIAAGSLLEHVMNKVKSFPVGRVEYLYMHPLNFEEYLAAKGLEMALGQLQNIPVQPFAHDILLAQFHEYAIIGGMPEVVSTFLQKGSLADLPPVYESIWATYKDDVEKYAKSPSEARVLKHIVSTAHLYVDQRIKFENFGQSNYRSREVGEAMRSLDDAKIIQLVYPTTDVEPPLKPDLKKSPRLQFLDTGLVNHELKIQGEMLAMDDLSAAYKGAIIPALITQQLLSLQTTSYQKPLFWTRERAQSSAEVDLVVAQRGKAIPIEIKSGKEGKLKSLHQFIEQVGHHYAVRLYAGEFKVEEHTTPQLKKPYLLMNLPYYLGTKIPEYLDYFVKNHRL